MHRVILRKYREILYTYVQHRLHSHLQSEEVGIDMFLCDFEQHNLLQRRSCQGYREVDILFW